jgi:hypothetical protein
MPPDPNAFAEMVVLTIKSALAPVLERMAAAEARLSTLGDLRDRVVTVETKAATPPDLTALRDRVLVLETRGATPDPTLVTLGERVATVERRTTDDSLAKDVSALRERMAVLEVRAGVPGPPGKDGTDGLGFDDLSVDFDGDRTLALRFSRDGQTKVFPVALPYQRYQGVYHEGQTYSLGDLVTWGGSTWHANEATASKPGDGTKAWTLCVKKGRDGRDGKDGKDAALPVVKVG